jgi:TFIIF-interacting CTD phosphatase-like protein
MTDKGVYVKDLRIFSNVPEGNLILIDNSPHCYIFNRENGIPIIPFYDNYQDYELLKLSSFLRKLNEYNDVRPVIEDFFAVNLILEHSSDLELAQKALLDS